MYLIKSYFSFIYLSVILICPFKCYKTANQNEFRQIDEIVLTYQDLYTLTPFRIDRKNFEEIFSKTLKTKHIQESTEIIKILNFLELTKRENKVVDNLDIRFKMILKYSAKEDEVIYGNGSVLQLNDIKYLIDKDFSEYLLNLTNSKI